jgi:inorganic pyrophosphatase
MDVTLYPPTSSLVERLPDDEDTTVWVYVETPQGSRNKYEYDSRLGRLKLDRTLHSAVHYPADYGFIPETSAPDGDHLDALVIVQQATFPGCFVRGRVIGFLEMSDENGEDQKILAVAAEDPRFNGIRNLGDLAQHWLREIEVFFSTYKMLEDKSVEVGQWQGRDEAITLINKCRLAYSSDTHRMPQL